MSSDFNKLWMDFIHKKKWSSKPGTLNLSNEPLGFTLQQGSLKEKLWSTPFSALPWRWAWKCSLSLPEGRVQQHQENFNDVFFAKMFPHSWPRSVGSVAGYWCYQWPCEACPSFHCHPADIVSCVSWEEVGKPILWCRLCLWEVLRPAQPGEPRHSRGAGI